MSEISFGKTKCILAKFELLARKITVSNVVCSLWYKQSFENRSNTKFSVAKQPFAYEKRYDSHSNWQQLLLLPSLQDQTNKTRQFKLNLPHFVSCSYC